MALVAVDDTLWVDTASVVAVRRIVSNGPAEPAGRVELLWADLVHAWEFHRGPRSGRRSPAQQAAAHLQAVLGTLRAAGVSLLAVDENTHVAPGAVTHLQLYPHMLVPAVTLGFGGRQGCTFQFDKAPNPLAAAQGKLAELAELVNAAPRA